MRWPDAASITTSLSATQDFHHGLLEGSVFHLNMRLGVSEFLPGLLAPTKAYNGDFLGPTLVLRSGRNVTLNVTNRIGVTTTTHWHGMHVPAVTDGGPHQTIQIGETWTASFPLLNRAFSQIVSDGGFLPAPVPMSRLLLAPAERAEMLVDLGADEGRPLELRSFNGANGSKCVPPPLQDQWDTTDCDLPEIRVGSATNDAVRTIREHLAAVTRIPESEAQNVASPRPFELNANPFGINGKRMDLAIIDQRIPLGATEVWEITNPDRLAHPFHVHGDSFQIRSRDGAPPPAHEGG